MSETVTTEAAPEHEPYDTETFAPGEACGVCHFPLGKDKICGNTVYANQVKGRLPQYCGQEGQAHWQALHGTEGNPRHQSSLAGYPRKTSGMSKDDIAALAAAVAEQRGIVRRTKSGAAAAVVPPIAPAESAPATEATEEVAPQSAVDALADLAQLIGERVAAVRAEMDAADAATRIRVDELDAERERLAEEVAAEKQGLAEDRAAAQAIVERAETEIRETREHAENEIREAREAQLRAEGELASAQRRIAELEQSLTDAEARHRAEIDEVREREEKRYDRLVEAFAKTQQPEPKKPAAPKEPTNSAVRDITRRVLAQTVNRVGGQTWYIGNVEATTPAAGTLDWMLENGYLLIGQGDPAPVSMVDVNKK